MGGSSTDSPDWTASNLLANITKQQYANYQTLYQPIENQQIAYATDQNVPLAAAQQAGVTSDKAFQASTQGQQKTLQGQGIQLTPQQKTAMASRNNLAKGLSSVGAMNQAAAGAYDTQTQILSGGAPVAAQIGSPATISPGV